MHSKLLLVGSMAIVTVSLVLIPGLGASSASAASSPRPTLSFAQAKQENKVGSINWGSRCNVATGKLKYPSFFAGECYAPFHGNNGGATAQGVTSKVIKIVLYVPEQNDPILDYIESAVKDTATNAQTIATMRNWVTFYNHYFETYGRKVELIPYTATGVADDPVAARADAVTIATNIKPFAVWNGPALTTAFADELAARHLLCIDCGSGDTNAYFQQRAPYVWSLGILPQQSIVHVTEFLKKQVSGRDASFAGEAAFKDEKRKFGMIDLVDDANSATLLTDWQKSFKAAGINVVQYVTYASPTDLQTQAPALIAKLKAAGVTSVIFSGDPVAPQTLTRAATAQNYFPEWIISGSVLTDTAAFARTYDQRQWAHAFGVSFGAARTGVTGAIPLYEWYFGHKPPDLTAAAVEEVDASLFFPVIQGVGPDLTAANFQKALFAGAPTPHAITQPSLSWGHHGIWPGTDYGGTDDATEVWWNPSISGPDELGRVGKGLYEYVDGGKRYLPGHWPVEATQAFRLSGAVAIYSKPPPSERVPNYPSPAR
ncbi:MAG: hypothetical protein ACRDY1_01540 [Acidimicrobiales bacterium]